MRGSAIIFSILLLLATAGKLEGQPAREIQLPLNQLAFGDSGLSVRNALRSWTMLWATSCKDTVFPIYIRQRVRWLGPDSTEHFFAIDSIRGRGAAREVFLTKSFKTPIETLWTWRRPTAFVMAPADTFAPGDSIWYWTPTTDSTYRVSSWLGYADYRGGWGKTWSFPLREKKRLVIWLQKVIGDPTRNFGFDQQAMVRFIYSDAITDTLHRWIEGSSPSPPPW